MDSSNKKKKDTSKNPERKTKSLECRRDGWHPPLAPPPDDNGDR